MKIETHEDYLEAKALLDDLNRRIDEAPPTAKPVFRGICTLHAAVGKYERAAARRADQ